MEDYLLEKMQEAHRVLRHDFMNALQVIYGFHQLGQPEKCKAYTINTIESNKRFIPLGKIGLPLLQSLFTVFLTMYNSNTGAWSVEVESGEDEWILEDDRDLTSLTMSMICPLEQYIADGLLRCRFVLSSRPQGLIVIYLQGTLEVLEDLKSRLSRMENPSPYYIEVQEKMKECQIIIGKKRAP